MTVEHMRASLNMGEEGTFTAIASRRDSIAYGERGPTRFADGAFRESLERGTKYPLLWQHKDDSPVGVVELSDTADGLQTQGKLALDVQAAREAHALLKIGAIDGVSIGFVPEKTRHETREGQSVRVVEKAKLMEVSLVTFPADRQARVTTVHREAEEIEEEVLGLDLETLRTDLERHVGRVFSEANLTKLRAALGSLVDLVEKVDPGHVAELGRRAARVLRKSFVVVDKGQGRKARAAHAASQVRRMDALGLGVDVPVSDLPLIEAPAPPSVPESDDSMIDYALRRSIEAALAFSPEARRPLLLAICKQFLVAAGEAEEVDADGEAEEREEHAEWTAAYVNDLPDSSFAVVESGGKKDEGGKTTPRSLRHLPYKDKDGKVDLPHLRNALARLDQTSLGAGLKAKARAKLEAAAKAAGVGDRDSDADADDREVHINNPHAVKDGEGWKVVDDDGHVYGSHKTKPQAEAQVRALYAAKGRE